MGGPKIGPQFTFSGDGIPPLSLSYILVILTQQDLWADVPSITVCHDSLGIRSLRVIWVAIYTFL